MKQQKGQTLIEVLAALSVAIIVLTAITYSSVNSLKDAQIGKTQTLANQLTQDGMEVIRNLRYADFATFSSLPTGSYCLADTCTTLNSLHGDACGPSGNGSACQVANIPTGNKVYIRTVTLAQLSDICSNKSVSPIIPGTQVSVTVAWTDAQCLPGTYCHNVSSSSCLTTYDVVPSP